MPLKYEPLALAFAELAPSLVELALTRDLLARLCEDHFEGDPLVPGAHVLGLAVLAGERLAGPVATIRRAGFRAPMRPETEGARVRASARGPGRSRVELRAGGDLAATELASVELGHGQPAELEPLALTGDRGECGPLADPVQLAGRLRHGPRALFVARMREALGPRGQGGGRFEARSREAWHWCELLDGAAQAAGLCLRSEERGEPRAVYVAAYERVEFGSGLAEQLGGSPWFCVRRGRRIMGLQQFDVSVEDPGGTQTLLRARVTLADADPDREARA